MRYRFLSSLPFLGMLLFGACLDQQGTQVPGGTTGASSTDATSATGTTTAGSDAATTTTTDAAATTTTTTTDTAVSPDGGEPSCSTTGTPCMFGGACCEGDFCAGGPYFYGECTPKQPIGAACGWHDECADGLCQEGACAVEGCAAAGTQCDGGVSCCSGWCWSNDYGPPHCQARLGFGSSCWADYMCESGLCRDGACASSCQAAGDGCLYDNDCCDGTFCYDDPHDDDMIGACEAKRAVGAACDWEHMCDSGACEDGVCVELGCVATEAPCFSDSECCTGACSYDTSSSYAPGLCFPPQPVGAFCARDAWCASQDCVEGVCAP